MLSKIEATEKAQIRLANKLGEADKQAFLTPELIELLIQIVMSILGDCFTKRNNASEVVSRVRRKSIFEKIMVRRAVQETVFGGSIVEYLRGGGNDYVDAIFDAAEETPDDELRALMGEIKNEMPTYFPF